MYNYFKQKTKLHLVLMFLFIYSFNYKIKKVFTAFVMDLERALFQTRCVVLSPNTHGPLP